MKNFLLTFLLILCASNLIGQQKGERVIHLNELNSITISKAVLDEINLTLDEGDRCVVHRDIWHYTAQNLESQLDKQKGVSSVFKAEGEACMIKYGNSINLLESTQKKYDRAVRRNKGKNKIIALLGGGLIATFILK